MLERMNSLRSASPAETTARTLEAFAQIVRALAAEVQSISFHDASGDTLWLSEDFLLPEDHELVEDALANGRGGVAAIEAEEQEDRRYVVVIPIRRANGEICGAARLGLNPDSAESEG